MASHPKIFGWRVYDEKCSAIRSNHLIFRKMMADKFWSLSVCDDHSTNLFKRASDKSATGVAGCYDLSRKML